MNHETCLNGEPAGHAKASTIGRGCDTQATAAKWMDRLGRPFEETELKLLGPGEGNGVALGETGVAVLIGGTGG